MGWMGWYAISANDRLKRGCFAVAVQFLNHRNASGVMPVRVSPAQHATEWLRGFIPKLGRGAMPDYCRTRAAVPVCGTAGLQPSSGVNSVIARAMSAVFSPRSFW